MAVKVFDQGLTAEQAAALAQAFTRLCEAPLDHPSIVAPHGAGLNGNSAWLAEPYVDATPLDRILKRGPQPAADVLLRVTHVAGALDFAAAAGIYHGALHPRDILIGVDRTLVTGLGVAQALAQADIDVPVTGAAVSPQRALDLPVSRTDDIFALAAMTGEMLYGRPIVDRAALTAIVTPITGLDHRRLRDVLARPLAADPAERPATALEFAEGLQQCILDANSNSTRHDSDSYQDSDAAAAPIPVPIPMPIPAADLPLRSTQPPLLHDSAFELESDFRDPHPNLKVNPVVANSESASDSRSAVRQFEFEAHTRAQPRSIWLPMAFAVAMAFVFGFGSGFIVGQREVMPAPRSAERAVPRAQRQPAEEARPTPTAGQDFTESAVAPEADGSRADADRRAEVVEDATVLPTEPESVRRSATRESEANSRPPAEANRVAGGPEATMEVVSRPAGAQVYVDGRLVGRTPLTLPAVDPGDHAVQIALPGHQRWVTKVNVIPGTRARVAASLER